MIFSISRYLISPEPVFLEGRSSWNRRVVCQRRPKFPGASWVDSKADISVLVKFARSKGKFIRNLLRLSIVLDRSAKEKIS